MQYLLFLLLRHSVVVTQYSLNGSALSYNHWTHRRRTHGAIKPTAIRSMKFQYSWNIVMRPLYCRTFYGSAIIATCNIYPHFRVNRFAAIRQFLFPCETVGSFLFETNSRYFSFLTSASLAPGLILRLTRLIKTLEFLGSWTSTVVIAGFCAQALNALKQRL